MFYIFWVVWASQIGKHNRKEQKWNKYLSLFCLDGWKKMHRIKSNIFKTPILLCVEVEKQQKAIRFVGDKGVVGQKKKKTEWC